MTGRLAHAVVAGWQRSGAIIRVLYVCRAAVPRREIPDTFRLVEQRYRVMAESFHEEQGRQFQLQRFAERVYEWRKSGSPDVNIKDFEAEVAALVKDRLMMERSE